MPNGEKEASYGAPGDELPCWAAECSGTITVLPERAKSRCTACGRGLPNADIAVKSVVLFLTILGLTLLLVFGAAIWFFVQMSRK
jgi:hypothetical protein